MSSMPPTSSSVLCWPKRLLCADDLRRHLAGQRELLLLPNTVITPLAADELKAKRVRVLWQAAKPSDTSSTPNVWICGQEKTDAMIESAIKTSGLVLVDIAEPHRFAEASLRHAGGVLFTSDAALATCIANKVTGVRAAAVAKPPQVVRAKQSLGANLFAIEIPGPTLFEIRQTLRNIVAANAACPDGIAKKLQELDGHAHR